MSETPPPLSTDERLAALEAAVAELREIAAAPLANRRLLQAVATTQSEQARDLRDVREGLPELHRITEQGFASLGAAMTRLLDLSAGDET